MMNWIKLVDTELLNERSTRHQIKVSRLTHLRRFSWGKKKCCMRVLLMTMNSPSMSFGYRKYGKGTILPAICPKLPTNATK
jgi:hypothetical protein